MKRLAAIAFLLCAASPAAAQQTPAELVRLGMDAYQKSETERAKQFFAQIIASRQQVTPEQRVTAYKYLGAFWTLQGVRDSALSFFLPAIELDPFTTLDPNVFAKDEVDAFNYARAQIFKVGISPIEPKALDPTQPDSARYTFRVVVTRPARLIAEIRSLNNTNITEPLATLNASGVNDIVWNGLINNARADAGLYEFRLRAEDTRGAQPVTEIQRFLVQHVHAVLEDTLPELRSARDTLPSERSPFMPYLQGSRGLFVASLAAALPVIALSRENRDGMSQWTSHFGIGIAIGAVAGTGAAVYANKHKTDRRAEAENIRRRQERAAFNAGVVARNKARLEKTILVIRPLSAGITG
jgi:hypothetical protein